MPCPIPAHLIAQHVSQALAEDIAPDLFANDNPTA